MTTWTTIPPWLYQNDLPDAELQRVYVREARKKVAELSQRLAEVTAEGEDLCRALERAVAFLEQAEAALARNQRRERLGRG